MENSGRCGTNWKVTKDIKEFHHLLYGDLNFQRQGDNKQAKIRTNRIEKAGKDKVRSV